LGSILGGILGVIGGVATGNPIAAIPGGLAGASTGYGIGKSVKNPSIQEKIKPMLINNQQTSQQIYPKQQKSTNNLGAVTSIMGAIGSIAGNIPMGSKVAEDATQQINKLPNTFKDIAMQQPGIQKMILEEGVINARKLGMEEQLDILLRAQDALKKRYYNTY